MRRAPAVVLATAVVASSVTVAVALVPQLHFAYRRPALHVALETAASLIALLACFLVSGRLRRRLRLNELLLACALGTIALSNLLFSTVPRLLTEGVSDAPDWAAVAGRSLGAILFVAAAFAPGRTLRRPRLVLPAAAVGVLAAQAVLAAADALAGDRFPRAVSIAVSPESTARPDLNAHPALPAVQIAVAALYAAAAIGFLRRSQRTGDEFVAWLAVASVLAMFSRVNYSLYPSLYSSWVYTGDLFRIAFYVVLLGASMREISSYWRAQSEAAVLEERRRIARDLHDGLAQEIAYLHRNLGALASGDGGHTSLPLLQRAAERARLESRRAISVLAAPAAQPLDQTLADAAGEIAGRFGIGLELELARGVELPAPRAEAVLRIACEAVANAARHSGASEVRVRLERLGGRVRLGVRDDGAGFDPTARSEGFGLASMRERARSVGGDLRISSGHGRGTAVEVIV